MDISPIEEIIRNHTESVKCCKTPHPPGACPRCLEQPETFKRHDARERSFRFILDGFVHIIISLLVRLKCPTCKKTFTVYPSFALPHKRYVLPVIERLAMDYLENEQQSYRETASFQGSPIPYPEQDGQITDSYFAHTTPWRWIGFFGSMEAILKQTRHLIKQKDPDSSIFREIAPIHPRKHRTPDRKTILQNARDLLRASLEFKALFGLKIFPHLAPHSSWQMSYAASIN